MILGLNTIIFNGFLGPNTPAVQIVRIIRGRPDQLRASGDQLQLEMIMQRIYIRATVKISEDQFSREGLKMTSDMHETL